MTEKFYRWDSADHLKTVEDIVLYFNACLEEAGDDAAFIAKVLGNIAHARGMNKIAHDTGLEHDNLCKALSGEVDPKFSTIMKVIKALGLRLHVEAASH